MIPASLYNAVYLILITVLSLAVSYQYQRYNGLREYRHYWAKVLCGILVIALIFYIGLRPVSGRYFIDMGNYASYYSAILDGARFSFDWETDNIIFDNLFAWWGSVRWGYTSFFLFIAAIYFGAAYLGIRKLFPNNTLAAYLVFLAAFSTFSYATNGIKAGAATSLFILAMGYRDNLKLCIPLVLLSWGFHHSMLMVVAAFIMTLLFRNPKIYYGMWVFSFLIAAAHITVFAQIFSGLTTEHGAGYLLGEGGTEGTKGGFRIDFILYSAVPLFVGWYAMFKKKIKLSRRYINLLNLYVCLNSVWMLCMYIEFTNRVAYLSWFLYPIVLVYPFLQEQWGKNRYKVFSLVMLGHLGFTVIMNLLVYV